MARFCKANRRSERCRVLPGPAPAAPGEHPGCAPHHRAAHCQGLPGHVATGNAESQLLKGDGKFTRAALP